MSQNILKHSIINKESAIQFGDDYTNGKIEDASLIKEAVEEAEKVLNPNELMVNLALLDQYTPYYPEIVIAINQAMIDQVKKNKPNLDGSSAYKIVYMLCEALIDEQNKLKPGATYNILSVLLDRFEQLVGYDRELARDLRKNFATAVNNDKIFGFNVDEDWGQVSDPED